MFTVETMVLVKKKKKIGYRVFQNRYPIMVKYLNIGKPIYWWILRNVSLALHHQYQSLNRGADFV